MTEPDYRDTREWPLKKWCLMACMENTEIARQPAAYVVDLDRGKSPLPNNCLQTFACAKCAADFAPEHKQPIEDFHLDVAESILRGD